MGTKQEKDKYKNAILYFAEYLTPYQLGKTKLAKLLYYLDFISYRDRKEKVTGALYYKQEYGPLAQDLTEMIADLVVEEKLEVSREVVEGTGKQKDKFHALTKPNERVFDMYEQELLRKLANTYAEVPTDTIVAKSHLEAPWVEAKNGAALNYELAFDIEDFNLEIEQESREEDKKIIKAVEVELSRK